MIIVTKVLSQASKQSLTQANTPQRRTRPKTALACDTWSPTRPMSWSRSQPSPVKGRTYCIQTENGKHNKRNNLMIEWVFYDWHGLCFSLKNLNSHLVRTKTHLIINMSRIFCLLFYAFVVVFSPRIEPWTRFPASQTAKPKKLVRPKQHCNTCFFSFDF